MNELAIAELSRNEHSNAEGDTVGCCNPCPLSWLIGAQPLAIILRRDEAGPDLRLLQAAGLKY